MTAISVSERLLEMAAFYTWLDFTLTIFHVAVLHSNEKRRGGNCRRAFWLLAWTFPALYFIARYRKVTIWPRVQLSPEPNRPLPIPPVMPFFSAHLTALA